MDGSPRPRLLKPREAAEELSTNVAQVKEWMRRAEHPLPSIVVGQSGKFRKVVAAELDGWFAEEVKRNRPHQRGVGRPAAR